jgi:hypothetical protein
MGDHLKWRRWPRTAGGCCVTERVRDWCAGGLRFGDGVGHDVAGQLVVSGRNGHRELAAAPAVALGGPPSTGPGAPGHPDIVGLEQSLRFQPVEVELRLVACDADRFCRLIAGHGLSLGAHEPVQLATYGGRPTRRYL